MAVLKVGSTFTDGRVIASTEDLGGGAASETTIEDAGNYFTSENTEGALQEIGEALAGARTSLVSSAQGLLGQ